MSLFDRIGAGILSGMKGAPLVAAGGFLGHLFGNWLYLQPMEQVPSDLLLVPFGCVLGFLAAFAIELFLPGDGMRSPWSALLLVALMYGGCNFNYAKGRGYRYRFQPGFLVDLTPEPASAERCGAACPPATEWTVTGQLRIRAYRLEGAVTAIKLWSSEVRPEGRSTVSNDPSLARFRGPTIILGEGELGSTRLQRGGEVSYPIRYSYQNRGAESGRDIYVNLYLTDAQGRESVDSRVWHVR